MYIMLIWLIFDDGDDGDDDDDDDDDDVIYIYILIGGWTFGLFLHIFGISSSQLTFRFFRGVDIPPTSVLCWRPPKL